MRIALVLASLLLLHTNPAFAQATSDPNVLVEWSFDSNNPVVTAPVSIGGELFDFVLATHTDSYFGPAFAEKLQRLPAELSTDGAGTPAFRRAPRASIGNVNLRFPFNAVMCGDLIYFGYHLRSHPGVIGLNALVAHIVQIDFDDSKVRFLQTVPQAAGERFDIRSLQKKPRRCAITVDACRCNDSEEEFYIDLESPWALSLCGALYYESVASNELKRVHLESNRGSGDFDVLFAGSLSRFQIGSFETRNVHAILNGKNTIGLGYLSRFVATFDFPNGVMYLQPGKRFDRTDEFDVSGIMARWTDVGWTLDADALPGSAAEFKLRRGDRILEVDGVGVTKSNLRSIKQKLRQEGNSVRIRFLRNSTEKSVEFLLKAKQRLYLQESDLVKGPRGSRLIDIPIAPEPPALTDVFDEPTKPDSD